MDNEAGVLNNVGKSGPESDELLIRVYGCAALLSSHYSLVIVLTGFTGKWFLDAEIGYFYPSVFRADRCRGL